MTLIPQYVSSGATKHAVMRLGMRVLYSDGSYDHGIAGWAVVEGDECLFQDWGFGVTSNMAEGMAVLEALKIAQGQPAVIMSDSMAWVNSLNRKKPLKGKGSHSIFEEAVQLYTKDISLQWIPGHTDMIQGNQLADEYARQARHCRISTVA